MKDSTSHVQAMADLLGVIEEAVKASGRFNREDAVGSFRNCMTLFVSVLGGPDDGKELAVTLSANVEEPDA
ncbi:MAG TPA: hypothetical protein VGH53_02530 [Streptosporangiaceae bacterium]